MPFTRPTANALRSFYRQPKSLHRLAARRITPNTAVRSYASTSDAAHGAAKKSSDMPWILGSVGFTIPAAWYLLQSAPAKHDAHGAHDSHKEEAKEVVDEAEDKAEDVKDAAAEKASDVKEKAEETTEKAKDKAQDVTENAGEKTEEAKEKAKETASDVTGKASETAEAAKEKASETTEQAKEKASGVTEQAKEKTSSATEAIKEKVDNITPDSTKPSNPSPSERDAPDAAKEPKSDNEMSGKQEGISKIGDTQHPVLHDERGEAISKKGEGAHDTARVQGTVDVNRNAK